MKNSSTFKPLGALSLLPFLGFLSLFLGAGLWFHFQGNEMAFYQFPAPSCALVGFALALVIGYKNVREHISTFANGIGEETVVLMCIIFLLAGAFSSVSKAMGAVDSTVGLGVYLLPASFLLPGLFLISCFVSLSLGTSMGTISTIAPIAIGVSATAGLDLPLVAGTVLGGAIFGDNLSIISDTTIAATCSQGCSMRDKMRANLKVALPASLVVLIGLTFLGKPQLNNIATNFSLIKVLPYVLVLALSLMGVHVVVVLGIGIAASIGIGLITQSFHFFDLGKIIHEGFMSITDVFYVTILIAGLAAIAVKEGGLTFLLKKMSFLARGPKSAQVLIATIASFADIAVANNTVAIVFIGPMAKSVAQKFAISPARSASIIDVFSCVWQGLIPHGAQLLLIGGLCNLSGFDIIPYCFYPMALGICGIFYILFSRDSHG